MKSEIDRGGLRNLITTAYLEDHEPSLRQAMLSALHAGDSKEVIMEMVMRVYLAAGEEVGGAAVHAARLWLSCNFVKREE